MEASGSAQEASGSASPSPSPSADSSNSSGGPSINTGNATTQVNAVNQTNTNQVNSKTTFHIANIFLDQNGNVDLTKSSVQEIDPSASLVVNQQNTGNVTNTVVAIANTGNNLISGLGQISTGAASVAVNIINFLNSNFINSQWDFVVLNIFGHLNGNIILPEPNTTSAGGGAVLSANQTNTAQVQNNVNSQSNTGTNQSGGSIGTGNALTVANLQNFVNTNLLGGNYNYLLINNLGTWNGQFLGWGTTGSQTPTFGQMLFQFINPGTSQTPGTTLSLNQTNNAFLTNQITTSANTGANTVGGAGNIFTGNAYSAINLINFVNSNIVNSMGFFGIINIFGTLDGDIGGVDHFPTPSPSPSPEALSTSSTDNTPEQQVAGGQLTTSMTTNVGTHVNPGDTVMVFIKVRNPGTGPVYNTKVTFNLYDSQNRLAAIQNFNLDKLKPGQTAKISFGLVLANTAPLGTYDALVQANGNVGPDNSAISSSSETTFSVGLLAAFTTGSNPDVQGASTQNPPVSIVKPPTISSSGIDAAATAGWAAALIILFISYIYLLDRLYERKLNLMYVIRGVRLNFAKPLRPIYP